MSIKRHADFERIRSEFIKYYGAEAGVSEYQAWITALNLDETKSYAYSQKEKFSFLKPMLSKFKEDKDNVYYRVLVGFPIKSMNDNLYTHKKLSAAAEGLIDAFDCNLNHLPGYDLPGVRYVAAKFEDGAVEAVLKVPKSVRCNIDLTSHMYDIGEGKPLYLWIDEHVIVNQSLEASEYPEFHFVGSALLTKDTLPGIPLSKISPLEAVVSEALSTSQMLKGKMVKIQVKGLSKMIEQHSCPTGQHWDAQKGVCVPDEGTGKTPQGTDVVVGDFVGDDSKKRNIQGLEAKTVSLEKEIELLKTSQSAQVISSLNVAKSRAESEFEELKITAAAEIERVRNEEKAKIRAAEFKITETENKVQAVQDAANAKIKAAEFKILETQAKVQAIQEAANAKVLAAEFKVAEIENRVQSIQDLANSKIKGAELKAAKAEENFIEESKRRQKAEGKVEELQKQVEKLDKQLSENNKGTINDGARIKELERRLQDTIDAREQTQSEHEKLAKKFEELDAKYREQLQKNLELTHELTAVNEDLLNTSQKAEKLDLDLKKAKRLAKITVNM